MHIQDPIDVGGHVNSRLGPDPGTGKLTITSTVIAVIVSRGY